jgi:hypothetical protein
MKTLELIESVKRAVYRQQYAGPAGPVPDIAELPAILEIIISDCERLNSDRTFLRLFRERLLAVLRGHGNHEELEDAVGPADSELNSLRAKLPNQADAEDVSKAKPGRPGYPPAALAYALEIRGKHPEMKIASIRLKCLAKFSKHDLPPTADSFRRWLNRGRAKRT